MRPFDLLAPSKVRKITAPPTTRQTRWDDLLPRPNPIIDTDSLPPCAWEQPV